MRYQKIYTLIWNDEKFVKLSLSSQHFFLYILTSPNSNLIGLYLLKEGYVLSDLNISSKHFHKCLDECLQNELIKYDRETSIVFIKNYLKYNPITNYNQLKACISILKSLPKTFLIQEFKVLLKKLPKRLIEGLSEDIFKDLFMDTEAASEELRSGFQASPKLSVTVTDTDSVSEKDKRGSGGEKENLFEEWWNLYPARNGKKLEKEEAKRRFFKIPRSDLPSLLDATRNYVACEMVQKGIGIKDPKRFLIDGKGKEFWREWLEPEKIKQRRSPFEQFEQAV